MRVRVVLVALLALVFVAAAAAVAVSGWAPWRHASTYQTALGTLPQSTLRASYTDWAAVRDQVDEQRLADYVDAAYDADLSRTSALEDSALELDELLGLSLRDAQWEAYGQSDAGSVAVLRVGADVDLDQVRSRLRTVGYDEPAEEGGVWAGSAELLARTAVGLTPVEQNVVLLDDAGLVLFSDDAGFAAKSAQVATGDERSLRDADHVDALAAVVDSPVSAVLWASDYACAALSMGTADDADRISAEELVARAGGVSPLAGLVMGRQREGEVTVAMAFETDEQAGADLQPRTDLASGEAPGQGRTFADRFSIRSADAEGALVVLRLTPRPGEDALLSDISDGPVLFATC